MPVQYVRETSPLSLGSCTSLVEVNYERRVISIVSATDPIYLPKVCVAPWPKACAAHKEMKTPVSTLQCARYRGRLFVTLYALCYFQGGDSGMLSYKAWNRNNFLDIDLSPYELKGKTFLKTQDVNIEDSCQNVLEPLSPSSSRPRMRLTFIPEFPITSNYG